jgi:hypothetical protein
MIVPAGSRPSGNGVTPTLAVGDETLSTLVPWEHAAAAAIATATRLRFHELIV